MVHADSAYDLPKKIGFAFDQKKDLKESIITFKKLNNLIKASTDFINILPPDTERDSNLEGVLVDDLFDDSDPAFSFQVVHLESTEVLQELYDYCLWEKINLLTMVHRKDGIINLFLNNSKTIKAAYDFHIPLMVLPN